MLKKDKESSYFVFSFTSLLFTIGVMLFSSISITELERNFKEVNIEYNREIQELKTDIKQYEKLLTKIIPSLSEELEK